jgi:hypothetical protein
VLGQNWSERAWNNVSKLGALSGNFPEADFWTAMMSGPNPDPSAS